MWTALYARMREYNTEVMKMAYKKFFVELDFDLEEFDPEKLTPDYVLGVVERKLCSRGVEAKIHTDNPYTKMKAKAGMMKLKAVILNNSVGKGRVIHIGCDRDRRYF